jgi:acetyl esterase/lipase
MSAAPEIPAELRQLLADIGPRWGQDVANNVRRIVDAYTPILAQAPKDGVEAVLGLAYGEDERQVLDIYAPGDGNANAQRNGNGSGIGSTNSHANANANAGASANDNGNSNANTNANDSGNAGRRPVVLFLHGGAFVDGHRDRSAEIYSNVLIYFARHGCVGVNMEYRLAPANTYPSGSQDVAGAVAWLRENVAQYGGDPDQIYLMGHSAGAAHAASYAYDRRHQPAAGHGLAGLIVVSGRVRAENIAENPNARKVEAYYGTDSSCYDDVSPVMHAGADSLPTMVAFAEYENPLIDLYCLELADRLAAAKRQAPRMAYARGHNHTSIIAHFNTAEEWLGKEILAFMHDCARKALR